MDPSTRSAYTAFAAAQWPRLVRALARLADDPALADHAPARSDGGTR